MDKNDLVPQDIIKADFNEEFFFAQDLAKDVYRIIERQPKSFDFLYEIKKNNLKEDEYGFFKYFSCQTLNNKIAFNQRTDSHFVSKYDFSNIRNLSRFFVFDLFPFSLIILLIILILN